MRKLLFIADSTSAYEDENGILFFRGSFSANTWDRYLAIAEEIVFVCRKDRKKYTQKEIETQLQRSPSNRIKVLFIQNPKENLKSYLSLKIKYNNQRLIDDAILNSDGVIIRTLGTVSSGFVIQKIKEYRKKYLYECVGNAWDALWNYGLRGKLLAPKAYLTEKGLACNADAVLYVTEKYLQSCYPTKAPHIGVSDVDIPLATNTVIENRLHKIRTNKGKLVLGTAGSVEVSYKGQEFVIRAVDELRKRGIRNIEYQLAGNGDNSRLKTIAKGLGIETQIVFLGTLSHDAVLEWLDKVDVYIQPSMLEGMPRALIEAMSRGVPSLGSNVGGIPELLDEDFLFKRKAVNEIANCISAMTLDSMISQAKRNFEFSKKFYPTEKNLARTRFYKEFETLCMGGKLIQE